MTGRLRKSIDLFLIGRPNFPRFARGLFACFNEFMAMSKSVSKNISEYIEGFPKETQGLLKKLRLVIKKAAPSAKETISYAMPCFNLGENLVYFAGYKKHVGFYPGAYAIQSFKKELSGYVWSKGAVQFPLDEPLPLALVGRIVKFRVKQVLAKQKLKEKFRQQQMKNRTIEKKKKKKKKD